MIDLLKELNAQFKAVLPQSYFERNRSDNVTYPYLTYDISSEPLERNVDGFYIDVDIFDNSTSYTNLFTMEDNLKAHFKDNRKLTETLYIRFNFLRSNKIPTGDETILRRNLQFYCKVDWRNK